MDVPPVRDRNPVILTQPASEIRGERIGRQTAPMADADHKADLQRYLQVARDALVWKLDGLSEYDVRRPMVPTGTNLLGLVKHVASVEAGYLGEVFGRPFPDPMPWTDVEAEPNADMWATADESPQQILELYRRVWAHSDATIDALGLDARARCRGGRLSATRSACTGSSCT